MKAKTSGVHSNNKLDELRQVDLDSLKELDEKPDMAKPPPDNVRAALWLLASGVLFTLTSVLVKQLGDRLDPFQITLFRLLVSLVLIAPFLIRAGRQAGGIQTSVPGLQILRGLVGTSAMMLGFYAIVKLPLAEAQAISFTRTLFLVPLAAFLLSEAVGVRRWVAVLIGFIGVLIILRPGSGLTFSLGALAGLGHAFLVAVATILVSIVSRHDRPVTLMFYTGLVGTLFAAIPAVMVWTNPTVEEYGMLFLMGVFAAAAHNCFIRAYAIGEASAIAPFDYIRLVLAGVAGYVVFDTIPDRYSWLGAIIIILSAFYIIRREAQLATARAMARET